MIVKIECSAILSSGEASVLEEEVVFVMEKKEQDRYT